MLVALACGAVSARAQRQEVPAPQSQPSPDELARLGLDELIAQLQPIESETMQVGAEDVVDPASVELKRRLDSAVSLTDEQARAALLRSGALRLRTVWPANEPFTVSMRVPAWLRGRGVNLLPTSTALRPAWVVSTSETLSCGNPLIAAAMRARSQALGTLPVGRHRLEFEGRLGVGSTFDIFGPSSKPPELGFPRWQGRIAFDVEIVADIDIAIPCQSSPELDAAVRAACGVLVFGEGTEKFASFIVDDRAVDSDPRLRGIGLSLAAELLHDDRIVAAFDLLASTESRLYLTGTDRNPFGASLPEVPASAGEARADLSGWQLRVRGTNRDVLKLWAAKERWSGELVLPLAELIARGRELVPIAR
ncbi:MAG: hypothetical protein EPO68_09705 [Planctomycetota bacterium]|nr:MAG: hypothetical protein EPO68_09705 [Planctomycetota bacterium]